MEIDTDLSRKREKVFEDFCYYKSKYNYLVNDNLNLNLECNIKPSKHKKLIKIFNIIYYNCYLNRLYYGNRN